MKQLIVGIILIATHGLAFLLGDLSKFRQTTPTPSEYGRFSGEPEVKMLDDGRNMEMTKDFFYIDPNEVVWGAPLGSVIDGASIPKPLWSLIGGPFEGQYRNASIVHDVACEKMQQPSDDVHRMFYFACLTGGVPEREAKKLYWAVQRFGPKWDIYSEMRTKTYLDPNGQEMTKTYVVTKPVRSLSEKMTDADIQWMNEYFESYDPDLEVVASLQPGVLEAPPQYVEAPAPITGAPTAAAGTTEEAPEAPPAE